MTQKEMINDHLETYGSITPVQALQEYGVMRLAARIADIKEDGYAIESELCESLNRFNKKVRYSRYKLIKS